MSDLGTVSYVTWGGKQVVMPATVKLGVGVRRSIPTHGIRRAIFDIAYGYVNGFPASAILFFVLTRSLSSRIERRALMREGYQIFTRPDGTWIAGAHFESATAPKGHE